MTTGKHHIICVTGGIGSGKSTVCRVLALRGVPVYDCDRRAKALMDSDPEIQGELVRVGGRAVVCGDGTINREHLAACIFADAGARAAVNAAVHAAVRADIDRWVAQQPAGDVVIETAIPVTSRLHERVDALWVVTAPEQVRIERVQARSGLTAAQISARIAAQQQEFEQLEALGAALIANDGSAPLQPQIDALIKTEH